MKTWVKYAATIGTSLVIFLNFTGCSSKGKDDTRTIPTLVSPAVEELKTQKVFKGSISKTSFTNGSIVPVKMTDMSFKLKGGNLLKLNVKAGDTVKAGQVIAELDVTSTKYDIEQEEIKLKQAQLSYDAAVQGNASDIQKQIMQLNVDSEMLRLEQLKKDVNNSVLTASVSGKVIFVADVKISQFISGYEPIVTIADTNSLQVQCQGNLSDFALGAKADIVAANGSYKGEVVTNTEQQNSNNTKVNKVVIKFQDQPKDLNVGDSVNITCIIQKKDNIIVVPSKAVRYGEDDHSYVKLSENGDIIERYIETGIQNGDYVEVTSGLSEGEILILN